MRAAAPVGADQDPPAGASPRLVPGDLREGLGDDPDVVGARVRPGIPRPQDPGERLTGAAGS